MTDDLMTTAEAARMLKLSHGRIKQLVQQQRLPSVKIGDRRLLRRADVEAFAAVPRTSGRPKREKLAREQDGGE